MIIACYSNPALSNEPWRNRWRRPLDDITNTHEDREKVAWTTKNDAILTSYSGWPILTSKLLPSHGWICFGGSGCEVDFAWEEETGNNSYFDGWTTLSMSANNPKQTTASDSLCIYQPVTISWVVESWCYSAHLTCRDMLTPPWTPFPHRKVRRFTAQPRSWSRMVWSSFRLVQDGCQWLRTAGYRWYWLRTFDRDW